MATFFRSCCDSRRFIATNQPQRAAFLSQPPALGSKPLTFSLNSRCIHSRVKSFSVIRCKIAKFSSIMQEQRQIASSQWTNCIFEAKFLTLAKADTSIALVSLIETLPLGKTHRPLGTEKMKPPRLLRGASVDGISWGKNQCLFMHIQSVASIMDDDISIR